MKKSKLLAAALAATMFATAACGLVACDKDAGGLATSTPDGPNTPAGKTYTVTFDADGGTLTGSKTLKTNTEGIVQGTAPTAAKADNTFKGWTLTKGTTTTITFSSQKFTKDTTVYAVYTPNGSSVEYTITFVYGEGTGSPASAETEGGMLTTLPTPVAPLGKKFDGWFTSATGGSKVSTSTPFSANGSIYAQYSDDQQQGGDDDVFADAVTIDTAAEDKGYMVSSTSSGKGVLMTFEEGEYGDQFVLAKYHLNQDTVFKFQNGTGSIERTTIAGGTASACFTTAAGGIKVVKSGTYTFYVKTGTDEIYVDGTPDFEAIEGDTITVTVSCADGSITFTIEKDAGKTPHLHAWEGSTDLFGDWPGKALTDGETVDLSSYNMTGIGLIINYGNGNAQTDDISFTSGGNKTILVSKDGGFKVQ